MIESEPRPRAYVTIMQIKNNIAFPMGTTSTRGSNDSGGKEGRKADTAQGEDMNILIDSMKKNASSGT